MTEFLAGLSAMQKFYAACAVVGGVLFLFRTVLLFAGHGGGDVDASGLEAGAAHGDADASFNILSLQSLSAFFMMFGLVALALSWQERMSDLASLFGGFVAGAATVWVMGRIFVGMKKLQSDGTLRVENAIGQEGSVYLGLAPGKTGQVRVAVQGQLRVFDAILSKEAPEALKTGDRIKVVGVSGGQVLVVEKM